MDTSQIIDNIIRDEGPATNDPQDQGGKTAFGISQRSNPQAWLNGPPTEAQARQIYLDKYVNGPKFNLIEDSNLQAQLVDFGVTSGPMIAIGRLQGVIGAPIDGVLGPETLEKLKGAKNASNGLMASRIKMIVGIVQKNPSQVKFLKGWVNRALEFLQ